MCACVPLTICSYSLGVILYVCLAGYLPFDDNAPLPPDAAAAAATSGRGTWEERVKAGRFYFSPPVWTHISQSAQDLIRHMMELDPSRRFTVAQAAAHPWFDPMREVVSVAAAVPTTDPSPSSPTFGMTPLASEIAAMGLSSPVRGFLPGAIGAEPVPLVQLMPGPVDVPMAEQPRVSQQRLPMQPQTAPLPPLHVRDPYAALYQQRLLLTSAGASAGDRQSPKPHTGGPSAAADSSGEAERTRSSSLFQNSLRWGGGGGNDDEVVSALNTPASSPIVSTPVGEWQRELGLGGIGSAGNSPPQNIGASGGASGVEDVTNERDLRILATVAKSLDFDSLLALQRNAAASFRAAYSAVRNVPNAASVLRKHAVSARELQHQVRKVAVRCRSLAQSILVIFPDLCDSIVDRDLTLTQGIFDRLRLWIAELKTESQLMQRAYAELIMEVQVRVLRFLFQYSLLLTYASTFLNFLAVVC
jgi:hypothetical protein